MWKIESYARNKLWHHLESLFRSKKILTSYMVSQLYFLFDTALANFQKVLLMYGNLFLYIFITCYNHFQPFIEACARYGNESLCRSFIDKLTNPVEIVDSLLLLKLDISFC